MKGWFIKINNRKLKVCLLKVSLLNEHTTE